MEREKGASDLPRGFSDTSEGVHAGPVRGGDGPGETILFWSLFKCTVMIKKKKKVCSRGIYRIEKMGSSESFKIKSVKKTKSSCKPARPPLR